VDGSLITVGTAVQNDSMSQTMGTQQNHTIDNEKKMLTTRMSATISQERRGIDSF